MASIKLTFFRQGDRIHYALAQDTPRKLALLIGINGYYERPLSGCANDVQLQYELLVHRYGFNPQDILIVTDENSAGTLDLPARDIITTPTRQTIINAFRDHLWQARPGDVAIFHYSGHGSYVSDPQPLNYEESEYLNISGYSDFQGLVGTLVPIDTKETGSADTVNDILGSTLFLLSKKVNTENFTTILDSCHSGGGVRGNLVYRAIDREAGAARNPSQAELTLQAELMADLGLTETTLKELREAGVARGVAMGSARANQLAAEKSYSGFQTGIFTYLLTRYLWQVGEETPPSLKSMFVDLARITRAIDEGDPQDPVYFVQPNTTLDQQPPYLVTPDRPFAEAVVRQVIDDQTVELWLGGVTPNALKAQNSIYQALGPNGEVVARLQQQGRLNRLKATARFIDEEGNVIARPSSVGPGTLLQEEVRGIPTDFSLQVGLHGSLGDDLEAVRQQLERLDRVTPVTIPDDANAALSSEADVLIGRFDVSIQPALERLAISDRSDIVKLESGSFGLFKENLEPLSDTFGAGFENPAEAIARLFPRFKLLLAQQALKSIINANTTGLSVEMEIGSVERGGLEVVSSQSARGAQAPAVPQLWAGENLSLVITNKEPDPLYIAVIGAENNGDMYVYHPSTWNAPENEALLGFEQTIEISTAASPFKTEVYGPSGFFEVLVIASREQLRDTLRVLKGIFDRSADSYIYFDQSREAVRGSEDSITNVLGSLLGDVSRTGASPGAKNEGMDNGSVVVFAATIEVIE